MNVDANTLNHERFIGFLPSNEGIRCCAPNQMTTPNGRAQCRRCVVQTVSAAGNMHQLVQLNVVVNVVNSVPLPGLRSALI